MGEVGVGGVRFKFIYIGGIRGDFVSISPYAHAFSDDGFVPGRVSQYGADRVNVFVIKVWARYALRVREYRSVLVSIKK